jgi:hypothetical protein
MQDEKVYYKTSNLNLASTLYDIGFVIDGIHTTQNSEIVEFYFEKTIKLEKAVDDFWSGRLRVEPNGLLTVRKELLDEIKRREFEKSIKKSS